MISADHDGIRGAIRRITSVREPLVYGYHQRLIVNQYAYFRRRNWALRSAVRQVRTKLSELLIDSPLPDQWREEWANAPHPKKGERVKAIDTIRMDGRIHHHTRVKNLAYKCKTGELLEGGNPDTNDMKYLRGIGDLTTPGATKCAYLMDTVKDAFAAGVHIDCTRAEFIKTPDLGKLREVFNDMIYLNEKCLFIYFSDDSCIAVRCIDKLVLCNLDISQCDGSNFEPVFSCLKEIMSVNPVYQQDIDGVFDQLEKPCIISSPSCKEDYIKLTPRGKILYSGSALTTAVNNMANLSIYTSIVSSAPWNLLADDAIRILREAAFRVGFIIKVEVCDNFRDIQFLKFSPFLNNYGDIEAVANLGLWMRGFGTFRGDLPVKQGKLQSTIPLFNSDVVRGRSNWGNHSFAESFRTMVQKGHSKRKSNLSWVEENLSGAQKGNVSDIELCQRYDITVADLNEICEMVKNHQYGRLSHPAISKILRKDYGLSSHSTFGLW